MNLLKNVKVRTKLIGSFLMMAILIAVVGIVGILSIINSVEEGVLLILVLTIVGFLLSIFIGLFISRDIEKPLRKLDKIIIYTFEICLDANVTQL